MKKFLKTAVILIVVLAGIIYVLNKNKAKNEAQTAIVAQSNSSVAVRADVVDMKELNTQYSANNTFMPKQEVNISAVAPGRVTKIFVKEGDYVKPGQILAVVDGDKQNTVVSNAQAVYNNAQAEVSRFESAFATGGVTKQQLDQVKLQLENAKNNLRSAQLSASDVNARASFAGIVNKKNVEEGQYVNAGQALFEIVDVSSLKLKVNVDEKNIGTIKVGQNVKIKAQVLSDQDFEGKITFIAPKADTSLNFATEVEVKNNEAKDLRAGMYGTVYFGDDKKESVLVAPRTAFVGSVSTGNIFVIKDGKATLVKVNTGRSFGDYIEIISGIEKGTQVVVSGHINLEEGVAVEVIK